ncbi:MAG TPA: hypothetical protein VMT67_11375 [Terriglobales bacterium]|nr:hypothetical protein [Terriglobales bacterium]
MVAAAVAGAAVAGVAGSAISSSISGNAAQSAANTQAQAAQNAQQLQWQQFQQLQQNLQPYMQLGPQNIPGLQSQLGRLQGMQFSFNPTMQQLEQTPGYQFTLNQGLNTVNNQLAAKGLNLSGAQARGIANYTTGLASNTYQQQYQNALQNFMTNYGVQSDTYNRLSGLVGLGENAAAGVGNAGLQTATNAGNLITQGANAQAAGTIGAANALSSGITGATSSLGSNALLYSLMNPTNAGGNIYGNAYSGFDVPSNYG